MKIKNFLKTLIIIFIVSCSTSDDSGVNVGGPSGGNNGGQDPVEYLREHVSFPIGVALSYEQIASNTNSMINYREVMNNEFNSLTFGNEMKMYNMFPAPDTYDWSDGDDLVAYAQEHGMRIHGHTLLWHPEYSIPNWLESFSGTDQEFEDQVKNYIINTVAHFAEFEDDNGNPIVESWDVVNEALTSEAMNAVFRQRIGEDYVAKCHQWARQGDANVKLFYNDYNIAGDPNKRNEILSMVNSFIANGVPIDGIGMQMHLNHNWPSPSELQTAIQQVSDTGLLVHISEIDVKVNYNDDITEFTTERAQAQSDQFQRAAYYYKTIVPSSQQFGITVWGLRDIDSWLYDNGTDWPLLFDNNFDRKQAYIGFTNGLKGISPD